MLGENKNLFIFGLVALLGGFGGWYAFSYFQERSSSVQEKAERVAATESDVLPTLEESKLEEAGLTHKMS